MTVPEHNELEYKSRSDDQVKMVELVCISVENEWKENLCLNFQVK